MLSKEVLILKVEEFLSNQKPKHSLAWRNEIFNRVVVQESKFPEQHIRRNHFKMIEEMIEKGKRHLKYRFPGYSTPKIEDIVSEALIKWTLYFNPERSDEGSFLQACINSTNADYYKKEVQLLGREHAFDEDGNFIFDISGRPVFIDQRSTTISFDFSEREKANKESNDDNSSDNESDFEMETHIVIEPIVEEEVHNIVESNMEFDDLSRENKILITKRYDDLRLKTENQSKKESKNSQASYDHDRRIEATEIIYRYYLLKNVAKDRGKHSAPEIFARYTPKKEFIDSINSKSLWNGNSATTQFYKKRQSILKYAREREFMELCVNELEKGIMALEREIKAGYLPSKAKKTIPVLSAVAVDKNNNIIDYCHKGQVITYNPQGQRRSFQKHCEYTLLEEIITEKKDKERLIGGTLYVTLEPCNKRTLYCKNINCDINQCSHDNVEVKIPCAVKCLESGVARIFIGSYDTNPIVKRKGEEILRTGCYTFELFKGKFFSAFKDKTKHEKDIRSQQLLESYFEKQGYELIDFDDNLKRYKINNGISVQYFPPDLIEEICNLNGSFLQNYNQENFH